MIREIELTDGAVEELISLSADWEAEMSCYGYRKNGRSDIEGNRIFTAEENGNIIGYLFGHIENTKNNDLHNGGGNSRIRGRGALRQARVPEQGHRKSALCIRGTTSGGRSRFYNAQHRHEKLEGDTAFLYRGARYGVLERKAFQADRKERKLI